MKRWPPRGYDGGFRSAEKPDRQGVRVSGSTHVQRNYLPPNLAGVSEDAATSKRLSNGHMRVAGHLAH